MAVLGLAPLKFTSHRELKPGRFVYTPTMGLNSHSISRIVAVPLVGAIQVHQTVFPAAFPVTIDSPGSWLARRLEPVTTFDVPEITMRLAKLSLEGEGKSARFRPKLPTLPSYVP